MSYQEIDPTFQTPEVLPSTTTAETIHVPRVFAGEACIERCNKLAGAVGCAVIKAAVNPQHQYDIVCLDKSRFSCSARVINTGQYTTFGDEVEGSDELFLSNPTRYAYGGGGPTEDIQQAIDRGLTPHHPREIKSL
jgi:hypothetical protein